MPSQNSTSLSEQAAIAAGRIIGFYPRVTASDPEIYIAGLIEILSCCSRPTIERSMSATRGVAASFKFLPALAEIKELLDGWEADERRYQQNMERWKNPRPMLTGPEHDMPPLRSTATRSGLCDKYGLPGIPPGWDAVDVAREAAKHRENFPAIVTEMLASGHVPEKRQSVFAKVAEQAREAMERRRAELHQEAAE